MMCANAMQCWVGALAFLIATTASAPASAAILSSLQQGTTTSTANGTVTVTITAVDTTKSFLVFQARHNSNRPVGSQLQGRIASATTIEFIRVTDEGAPGTMDIRWFVASFSSGVKVQRGEVAISATTINVPITAVAGLGQAFVLFSRTPTSTDATTNNDDTVVGEITTTTNLQFRVNAAIATHTISWQVIEYTSAADINVQKGSITSMTGTALSVNATLGTAVDVDRTFLLVGFATSGNAADIGSRLVRARLINSTTITIDRSISGTPDDITEIFWHAVELKDGSTVQNGSENFPNGTAQRVVTLASPIDTTRTIAFSGVQAYGGQSYGSTPYAGDDLTGVASVTTSLSRTQLTLDRNSTVDSADVGWFVVQFRQRRVIVVGSR
jgi:hypothetical protein